MQSGDYGLGIEPCTSHLDNKTFLNLQPGEKMENKIVFYFEEQI